MGTGGRSLAIPKQAASRHSHCQQPVRPRPRAPQAGRGGGEVPLSGLPLRRYSVPETVMRRCSLQSQSSDSGDGLSPTRGRGDHGHRKVAGRVLLDDNDNVTTAKASSYSNSKSCPQCASVIRISRSEVRCARRVAVEQRSAQCSAHSSTVSSESRTCATACSECYSAQLTTMHEEAQWSESGGSERLCVHCGRRATGSKPCTPKETLADRYEHVAVQARTSVHAQSAGGGEQDRNKTRVSVRVGDNDGGTAAVDQCVNVASRDNKGVVRTESKVVSNHREKASRDDRSTALTMATQTNVSDYQENGGKRTLVQTRTSEKVFQSESKAQQTSSVKMMVSNQGDSSVSKSKAVLCEGQKSEANQKDTSSVSVKVAQDENASKVRVISKDKESKNMAYTYVKDKGKNSSTQMLAKQIAQVERNNELNTRQGVKLSTNSLAARSDPDEHDVRMKTSLQCRVTDNKPDQDKKNQRSNYKKMEDLSPELMTASEGGTSSFNLSLAGLSTNDSPSPSPTPTPSPTTFRSRRPSSERLSTPESLRSGPIEAMDTELKSSSSSSSLDQSVQFSRVESVASHHSEPNSPQRARNPRFGARTSSSLDTRTPTPYQGYREKVHVVSDTSSFIILDELDNEEEPAVSGTCRGRRPSQARRGASFEVLPEEQSNKAAVLTKQRACRKLPTEHEDIRSAMKGARRQHVQATEGAGDVERDSLNGSVIDMFGVDEEGNILFSESGVQSRRGSKFSCLEETPNVQQLGPEQKNIANNASTGVSGNVAPAATSTPYHTSDNLNHDGNTRMNCTFHVNNNASSLHNLSNCNGYRETVKSDHHSQEQTFFCGVKEVYSVTTEKVEKWGNESREWLEKTTSHRIQHQHPHHARAPTEMEKQFNLSNRINVANNNPILIASEIMEIPPDQRFRTTTINQQQGKPGEPDFTLPSIRPTQEANKPQNEWGRSATTMGGVSRQGDVVNPQHAVSDVGMGTAHVRFVNGDQYEWNLQHQQATEQQNAQRQRRIVTDLVGTEPAEVHVAVPRYSALPRTRSMVVNTSSGEEDDEANDSGSECLSCADSLESERTPRSATKHDDKPVRGHVVLAEPKRDRKARRIRIQSPKAFFINLSDVQAEEEDVPVYARMPKDLRDKLIERHTMVKLQMAQNKRYLRTVCNASVLQAHPSRYVRVGVSNIKDLERKGLSQSEVAVEVESRRRAPVEDAVTKSPKRDNKIAQTSHHESKGDQALVPREKSRGRREVPAVVRVHKCHMEDQVKTTFKAKPYKHSTSTRISEVTSTHHDNKHHHEAVQTKRLKEEVRQKLPASKPLQRDVKVQVRTKESKGNSRKTNNKTLQVKIAGTTDKTSKDESSQVYPKERSKGVDKSSASLDATWTRSDYTKPLKSDVRTKERISIEHSQTTAGQESKQYASTHITSRQKAPPLKEVAAPHNRETRFGESEMKRSSLDVERLKDVGHTVETQTTPRVTAIVKKESVNETEKTTTVTRRAVEMTSVMKKKNDNTQTHVQMQSYKHAKSGEGDTASGHVHNLEPLHSPTHGARNVSMEVAAQVHIDEGHRKGESALCPREQSQPSEQARTGTTVHTSVKTTVHNQDGTTTTPPPTHGENSIRNLLELGSTLHNAEIRQKVVEVETTIQKNVAHHNVVETETTVEKNVITKRTRGVEARTETPKALRSREDASVHAVEVQVPTPPQVTPRPGLALTMTSKATGPATVVRRQTPVQRFRQRFEVIPEERNGLDERRFIIKDGLSMVATRTSDGHSSIKGRAALHQRTDDIDLLTLSKGWINFYQMEETAEVEDTADGPAVERVEYTMQIRAVPEPPPPAVASVAVGPSPPPKVKDAAVSPSRTAEVAVGTTTTADAGVSATRPVDVAVSATGPVDVAVSTSKTADAAVSATRAVDVAVSTAKAVDVAVSTAKAVDVAVCTTKAVNAAVSTTDGQKVQKTSPARAVRRPAVAGRPAAPRPAQRPAVKAAGAQVPHRMPAVTVSKASGPATYQARAVGTTDLEDASTNTLCGPLLPPPLPFRTSEVFTMTRSDACAGTSTRPEEARTRDAPAGAGGLAPCGIVPLSSCRRAGPGRRERLPKINTDISDVLSTSSDSTEYMAPPGARDADWDSTSPCWRRGAKNRAARAGRARPRNGVDLPGGPVGGLYQHQVPPQPQQSGPPPRDGVGWTVTLAGAGAKQNQGSTDLEMRLLFPTEQDGASNKGPTIDVKDTGVNTQPIISTGPGGRWSLTIRNQLPGDADASQGLSLSMVPGPQENVTATDRPKRMLDVPTCVAHDHAQRLGRSAQPRGRSQSLARRPLSLIWPRMHQDPGSTPAPELSEAETVLSVTGSAIQRRTRHLYGHRR